MTCVPCLCVCVCVCVCPQHMFNDHEVPQPWGSFNERDIADKPAWVRSLPLISQQNLTYLNEAYRQRLRALRCARVCVCVLHVLHVLR